MLVVFACPLVVMLMLYTKIFFIIRESQYYRSRGQLYHYSSENSTVTSSVRTNVIPLQSSTRGTVRTASDHRSMVVQLTGTDDNGKLVNSTTSEATGRKVDCFTRSTGANTTPEVASIAISEGCSVVLDGCAESRLTNGSKKNAKYYSTNGHRKALFTTLSIVGTYIFFYMPSVIFLTLTCDACPFPLGSIPRRTKFWIALTVNLLFVSKGVLDPFIYLFRYKEVKDALERLFNFSCCKR